MRCRRPRPSLCTCPLAVRLSCGVGRAFSLPVDRTSPRGSLAEPVCFLPRHTGRPSRSQICFPRGSSPAAALRMRTSGTRCWRSSGSARAPTRGAGVSPAGLACDGSQPSRSNKVRLVETARACELRALPLPRVGTRRVCRPVSSWPPGPVGPGRARLALNCPPQPPVAGSHPEPLHLKSPCSCRLVGAGIRK